MIRNFFGLMRNSGLMQIARSSTSNRISFGHCLHPQTAIGADTEVAGKIDAAMLQAVHAQIESSLVHGKIVLEGF
jgi:hypothetical protein